VTLCLVDAMQVSDWTRRYRSRGDGSFPGTGPAVYNGTVYFTDNTFSGLLFGPTFKIFSVPLVNDGSDAISTPCSGFDPSLPRCPVLAGHRILPNQNTPGFFFFSLVVSPLQNDILVWDSASRTVQARELSDVSKVHWEAKSIINGDCINVAAKQGHLYLTDYSDGPRTANQWTAEVTSADVDLEYKSVAKYFIVLDAADGHVLANLTLTTGDSIFISMIIPGGNNDVFLGTRSGIVRIFVRD